VRTGAIQKFPGNDLPNFKNNKQAKAELEELATSLIGDCSYEPAGFGREGIKQHILDVLNERRRNHRNGRDYEQVILNGTTLPQKDYCNVSKYCHAYCPKRHVTSLTLEFLISSLTREH